MNFVSRSIRFIAIILAMVAIAVCNSCCNTCRNYIPPAMYLSGQEDTTKTGAALLQQMKPLDSIAVYLDGFHFPSENRGKQLEAHHYCTKLNEDFTQCVIYSNNGEDALLMGVEYVISEKLFSGLSPEERKMWHSHRYEVKSGQLIAPGLPDIAEHELMGKLVSTYGKTWHTWDVGNPNSNLPVGIPMLMMSFTNDGQIDPALIKQRDERFGISTLNKRAGRQDITDPRILPGADSWQSGQAPQLDLKVMPHRR
ncbi:MAG: OBAP family protein [Syntrophorhabdaceae bacterium]